MKSALNKNTRICALNTFKNSKHNTDTHKLSANRIFGSRWFVKLVVLEEKKLCTRRVDEPSTGVDLFYTNPNNNKTILCPHLFYMLDVSLFSLLFLQFLSVLKMHRCWTVYIVLLLMFYHNTFTSSPSNHIRKQQHNCPEIYKKNTYQSGL